MLASGCTIDRDVDLGGDRSPLTGRYAVRAGLNGGKPCVGAACTRWRVASHVGPNTASCLSGGGTTCAAKLEVRLRDANDEAGPALPIGASVALPSPLVTDVDRVLSVGNIAAPGQAAALRILAVTTEERCGDAPCQGAAGILCTRGPAKLPCGVAQETSLVPDGSSGMHNHLITLRRLAHISGPREVIVRVLTSGDPSLAKTPWRAVLRQRAGAPHLLSTQTTVAMPWKGPGAPTEASVRIVNVGDATGEIYGFALAGQSGFVYRLAGAPHWRDTSALLSAPVPLPAGAGVKVELRFTPGDTAKKHATLTVNSDTAGVAPVVHAIGNGSAPCLLVSPAKTMALGALQLGECAERRLELRSCGTGVLAIQGLTLQGATSTVQGAAQTGLSGLSASILDGATANLGAGQLAPGVQPSPQAPVVIPPGGARKLRVRYCPSTPQVLNALIRIQADGVPDPTLHVQATAVTSLCPVAAVSVQEGSDVVPLTPLHLDGSGSHAPIPGPLTYLWTVEQPAGSHVALSPSAKAPAPTFTPTVAGPHTFCLSVRDAQGHPACALACATVQVIPEDGMYVELLWETPGDPNDSDTGPGAGSDLDLHLAHALAVGPDLDCDGAGDPWFHSSYDAYWANAAPAWGSASPNAADDPTVDLDDTDGAGPELISITTPEAGNPGYSLGVHYWNDHGFGTAKARVRVFLSGTLAATFGPVALQPLDFWTIGRLAFQPTANATAQITACWQSAPPCVGGKRWLPTGLSCVSPCYLPVAPPSQSHATACAAAAP